jgi:hypothetical protein
MQPKASAGLPARIVQVLFWEFIQNLPLVAGFLFGLHLWRQEEKALAVICMIAGSIVGSCIIWATESRIVDGHRESLQVVLANVCVITALMLVLVAYLSALWSRWWMDLVLGLAGGIALGVAQDLAARSPIGLRHCLAMAAATALALVAVRLLSTAFPLWICALALALVVTVIIALMDYSSTTVMGAKRSGRGS